MTLPESGVLTVVDTDGPERLGTVATVQGPLTIDLRYLPDAHPGDRVLFHSGIGFRIVERSAIVTGS